MKTARREIRDRKCSLNMFSDVLKIIHHRFKSFPDWINRISDPRHQSYIKYGQNIIFMEMLMASCSFLKSMRSMTESFNDYTVINNFSILLDGKFNELPHGDTVNNYFKEVDVD